jgi:hypothetical protein
MPQDDSALDLFSYADSQEAGAAPVVGDAGSGDEFALEVDAEGNPIIPDGSEGDGPDDSPSAAPRPPEKPSEDDADTVKIKKTDWERLQSDLAEMRGFIAAKKSSGAEPVDRPDVAPEAVRRQPQEMNFEQQLDMISERLTNDLASGDPTAQKNAVKSILTIGAQAGFNNARALFGTIAPAQAQSIVDSYITRKSAKDPLYDQGVGEIFENILGQYDTSVLVGQPRKVVMETLDTMYQRAKGDWADRQYAAAQERRATQKQRGDTDPPNLGGGRSGSTQNGRKMTIPKGWVEWARSAGIAEEEMQETFASMVRSRRGAE